MKRVFIAVVVLLSGFLIYTAFVIRQPDHFKKRTAEAIGAEYLGDSGVVLQRSSNDCGPSALKMLLDAAGIVVPRNEIERIIPLTDRGSTMLDLRSAAEQKGLTLEGWNLSADTLPHIAYPAMLFIRKNHYIVADSLVNNHVYARDPSIGRIRIPIDRITRVWNGEALLILAQKH